MGHDLSGARAVGLALLGFSLVLPTLALAMGLGPSPALGLHLSTIPDPLAPKQQPFFSVETFPLPAAHTLDPSLQSHLALETGVAGTAVVGIRLKIGMPEGYLFESVELGTADAVFLLRDRGFLGTVGHMLSRALRFLLLGQLVTAGTDLEIPGAAWSLLLDVSPLGPEESVDLHTSRRTHSRRGDANTTDHGEFVVCRFLVAANHLSELVGIHVEARDPHRDATVRYHLPRLKLPDPGSIQPKAPADRSLRSVTMARRSTDGSG